MTPGRTGKEERKAAALEKKQLGLKDKEDKKGAKAPGKEASSGDAVWQGADAGRARELCSRRRSWTARPPSGASGGDACLLSPSSRVSSLPAGPSEQQEAKGKGRQETCEIFQSGQALHGRPCP